MSIDELLNQLEVEREGLAIEYRNYYEKSVEAKKAIRLFYEYESVSPDEVPLELIEKFTIYSDLHTATVCKHNRILSAINIIKERVSG